MRTENGFILYKAGGKRAVEDEVLASKICQCFDCRQVLYREGSYDGEMVSVSEMMTSKEYSITSREAFEIYAANHDLNPMEYVLKLDSYSYYMMNILDYLVGNTDRHWGNWGFLMKNENYTPVALHPLMDFNRAFHAYDTVDGANCQTVLPQIMTQREAAMEAVSQIGLNQIEEVDPKWFSGRKADYEMFLLRISILRDIKKV